MLQAGCERVSVDQGACTVVHVPGIQCHARVCIYTCMRACAVRACACPEHDVVAHVGEAGEAQVLEHAQVVGDCTPHGTARHGTARQHLI